MEEIRMHMAYRWFTRLGFEQEIPDHSTFSKNRHGRFRQAGIFLEIFEEIVRRCIGAGLVEGKRLTVDGTVVAANASSQRGVQREQLEEVAKVSRAVREYLAEVARENPVSESENPPATSGCGGSYKCASTLRGVYMAWGIGVAVGTTIAGRPPAQIRTCALTHTALTEDEWRRSACRDKDAEHGVAESTGSAVG